MVKNALIGGLLALGLLAVPARADDAPAAAAKAKDAPEPPKQMSQPEFDAAVRAVRALDLTTVAEIAKFRELAAGSLIVRKGKVADVRPCQWDGAATVAVDVSDLVDKTKLAATFTVGVSEKHEASKWGKGDPLWWLDKASVDDGGRFSYTSIYDGLADLHRGEPAPGTKGQLPAPKSPQTNPQAWCDWLAAYSRICCRDDWTEAATAIVTARRKEWTLIATVDQVYVDRGCVVVVFDDSYRVHGKKDGELTGRWWGIRSDPIVVEGVDAEALAGLSVRGRAKVRVDVLASAVAADLQQCDGRFNVRVTILGAIGAKK